MKKHQAYIQKIYDSFIKLSNKWKIGILIAVTIIVSSIGINNQINQNTILKSIPISASSVKILDLPVYIEALGTVTAINNVNVQAQVNGQLIEIFFEDGQLVKKDTLLAKIDSRNYQSQLEQAKGQLLRDESLLTNAKLDLKRYQDLWKQNSISKQTLDTQISLVKQYEGLVVIDKAAVNSAEINLDYCNIKAPIAGKVGLKLITEGNLVSSSSIITTINSTNPISVIFSIPEEKLAQVANLEKNNLVVEAYDNSKTEILAKGKLTAIDNQVDTATGTVKLKAVFHDSKLFPNQFVNIKLLVQILNDSVIVPTASVQFSQNIGNYVYLLSKDKKTVKVTPVKIGISYDNNIVITAGLSKDQMVATSGIDKLTDGAAIFIPEHTK